MFLLDTDICIYLIKKKSEVLLSNLQKNVKKGVYLSSITLAELEYGIENSTYREKNRMALLEFLLPFEIIDFSHQDARAYGSIKANLRRRGVTIGPMDFLIAAIACSRDFTLVTNNLREFQRLPKLKLQNWAIPK